MAKTQENPLLKMGNDTANENDSEVDVSASDSWVSSCPLQDLNFINCHLMACDSQNGFPRGSQETPTWTGREGTHCLCLLLRAAPL